MVFGGFPHDTMAHHRSTTQTCHSRCLSECSSCGGDTNEARLPEPARHIPHRAPYCIGNCLPRRVLKRWIIGHVLASEDIDAGFDAGVQAKWRVHMSDKSVLRHLPNQSEVFFIEHPA